MIPVLSTRAFGRPPTTRDFALAQRLGFLDFELWMEPVESLGEAAFDEWRRTLPGGVRFASVHLPAADRERALDHAVELGTRLAIVHAPASGSDFERLLEQAGERSVRLAFENDTGPGTSSLELQRGLSRAGALAARHGLCLDLSRMHPPLTREIASRVLCAEASSTSRGRTHAVPEPSDLGLRELLRGLPVEAIAYEVVPLGSDLRPPGEAQLTMLLRSVIAFHLSAAGALPAAPSSAPPG